MGRGIRLLERRARRGPQRCSFQNLLGGQDCIRNSARLFALSFPSLYLFSLSLHCSLHCSLHFSLRTLRCHSMSTRAIHRHGSIPRGVRTRQALQ